MKYALTAVLLIAGCHRTYYKQNVVGTEASGGRPFIFWREYKPVSNRVGVCAEVYELSNGKWGGENHRRDAPWEEETHSHVGFAKFDTRQEAEAWGDKTCPN